MYEDDFPANPHLQPIGDRDLGRRLGLPAIQDDNVCACSDAFILSALVADDRGHTGVRYSRDSNQYGQKKRGHTPYWSRENVCKAVDHLTRAGRAFVHERQCPQNPKNRVDPARQSRLLTDVGFHRSDFSALLDKVEIVPDDRIILRDTERVPLALPDDEIVRQTREFLAEYDERMQTTDLALTHPDVIRADGALFVPQSDGRLRRLRPQQVLPYRIFNNAMTLGGRLYRTWWNGIGGKYRNTILIDGESVFEFDLSACHLRLAYWAVGGDSPPVGDAFHGCYFVPGLQDVVGGTDRDARKVAKISVQIMLNARNKQAARHAMSSLLTKLPWKHRFSAAIKIMELIQSRYKEIENLWCRGVGIGFQFVDSEVIRHVLTTLMRDDGVVGLSVHDSILVPRSRASRLVGLMENTFESLGRDLAYRHFSHVRHSGIFKKILTMEKRTVGVGQDAISHVRESKFFETRKRTPPRSKSNPEVRITHPERLKGDGWSKGALPRIVPVRSARPWVWVGVSKSSWYVTTTDRIQRQVEALKALVERRELEAIDNIRKHLARAKLVRLDCCPDQRINADTLFDALEDVLTEMREHELMT